MSFKRILILGGAALLVAGCGTDVTSPIAKVDASASARGTGTTKKVGAGRGMATSMEMSDSTSCKSPWVIVSGASDTACAAEP